MQNDNELTRRLMKGEYSSVIFCFWQKTATHVHTIELGLIHNFISPKSFDLRISWILLCWVKFLLNRLAFARKTPITNTLHLRMKTSGERCFKRSNLKEYSDYYIFTFLQIAFHHLKDVVELECLGFFIRKEFNTIFKAFRTPSGHNRNWMDFGVSIWCFWMLIIWTTIASNHDYRKQLSVF